MTQSRGVCRSFAIGRMKALMFKLQAMVILGFSIGNYCKTLRGIWLRTTMWMNCLLAIILVASAYKRQYYFFISVSEY